LRSLIIIITDNRNEIVIKKPEKITKYLNQSISIQRK